MAEGGSSDGASLSLNRLSGEGLEGRSFTEDPGKYVKKCSG